MDLITIERELKKSSRTVIDSVVSALHEIKHNLTEDKPIGKTSTIVVGTRLFKLNISTVDLTMLEQISENNDNVEEGVDKDEILTGVGENE